MPLKYCFSAWEELNAHILFLTICIRQVNFVLVMDQNISWLSQSHLPLGVLLKNKGDWLDTRSILVLQVKAKQFFKKIK